MTVRSLLSILHANLWIVVSFLLGGLLVSLALSLLLPKEYESTASLYISAQGGGDSASNAYQGGLLSEQRVTSYTELATSTRVSSEIVERLQLSASPQDISQSITATASAGSVIIDLTASDGSPQRAADIANTGAEVLSNLVASLEQPVTTDRGPAVAVRLVQPAFAATSPTEPNTRNYLVLGVLIGLLVGTSIVVLKNSMDRTVTTPEQVQDTIARAALAQIEESKSVQPELLGQSRNFSVSEQYRKLRLNLKFYGVDDAPTSILVTSANESEGKTTTATMLAKVLAQADYRTLIVDADMRRPRAAHLLGASSEVGLSSILSKQSTLEQALQRSSHRNLDILSSGPLPPNASELLSSRRMGELMGHLRTRYNVVVVDSPPVLPVADATALAQWVDGILLVLRYGHTTRPALQEADSTLQRTGTTIFGCVISRSPKTGSVYYTASNRVDETRLRSDDAVDPTSLNRSVGPHHMGDRRPSPLPRPRPF